MTTTPIPIRARVYLLCALFDLDPSYWPWQLQVDPKTLFICLPDGDEIQLGPHTPPDPTPSCYRAAALLMLAAGGKEAKALQWAGCAGMSENDLRETFSGMQVEFADELRAIERRIERWTATNRQKEIQWPRDIRDLVSLGYLSDQIQGAWSLNVVDPDDIKKLDAAAHPAAAPAMH